MVLFRNKVITDVLVQYKDIVEDGNNIQYDQCPSERETQNIHGKYSHLMTQDLS